MTIYANLSQSGTIRLSANNTLTHEIDALAALKAKCRRILVIHSGTAEYSVHRQWDAAERSVKNLRRFASRRQQGLSLTELEAICETIIMEQAEVVILIGRRSKRVTRFFLNDPAAVINRRTKIPVVVVA